MRSPAQEGYREQVVTRVRHDNESIHSILKPVNQLYKHLFPKPKYFSAGTSGKYEGGGRPAMR